MKIYVTFGQFHIHYINNIVINKNCVVVLNAKNHKDGRKKTFDLFDKFFFTTYLESDIDSKFLSHFHKGLINL